MQQPQSSLTSSSSSPFQSDAQQRLSNVLVADARPYQSRSCSGLDSKDLSRRTTVRPASPHRSSPRASPYPQQLSRPNPRITIYDHSVPEIPIRELCLHGLDRLSSLPIRQRPSTLNNSTLKDRRLLFVPPLDSRGRAIQGRCWSRKSAHQYAIVQAQARAQAQLLSQHFSSQLCQLSKAPSYKDSNSDSSSSSRDVVRKALAPSNPSIGTVSSHTVRASLAEDCETSHLKPQHTEIVSASSEPEWELVMDNDDDDEDAESEDEAEVGVEPKKLSQDGHNTSFANYRRNSFSHELPSVLKLGPSSAWRTIPATHKESSRNEVNVRFAWSSSETESESGADSESDLGSDDDSESSFGSSSSSLTSDEEDIEIATATSSYQSDSPRDLILTMQQELSNDEDRFAYKWQDIEDLDSYSPNQSLVPRARVIPAAFNSKARFSPYSFNCRHSRSPSFSKPAASAQQ